MARREPVYMYNARPLDHGVTIPAKTVMQTRGTVKPIEPATKEEFNILVHKVQELYGELETYQHHTDYIDACVDRYNYCIDELQKEVARMESSNASHRGGGRIVIKKGRNTVNIKLR